MAKKFDYKGKLYRSIKHPLLEYIFESKINNGDNKVGDNIIFTLADISKAYKNCGIAEPASISNTILDLTRKDMGVDARLPKSISQYGYDLKKRTGIAEGVQGKLAGEFVFVGIGQTLKSWLIWPDTPDKTIRVANKVPDSIVENGLLGRDEGALFSVIDYCDVLSLALQGKPNSVIRVQNPKKWQPNEIDGLYYSEENDIVYPCEAKALSTGDDINLEQMWGG